MNNLLFKLLICLSFLLVGCSSKSLVSSEINTNCNTTIEGNFYTPSIYKYYSPAILFKKGNKKNFIMGNVLSSDANGINFIEKKQGSFHTPDTLYFEYNQLRAIVDDNNFCVWGKLDEKEVDNKYSKQIKLELYKIDSASSKSTFLELTSNKNFSYCISPGEYIITRIIEGNEKDSYKETIPQTLFKFYIEENAANYIGDLHFIGGYDTNDSTFTIPTEKKLGNFLLVGDPFTTAYGLFLSGAVALNKINNEEKWNGCYNLNIKKDIMYKTSTNLKLVNTELEPFFNYKE